MDSRILLIVLSLGVLVQSECKIHEQEFIFYNISDLGVAVLDNNLDAVDDLIKKGCDVNYNGTGLYVEIMSDDYDYEYDYYEDYEDYEYGEYYGYQTGENDNSSFYVSGVTALGIAAGDGNVEFVEKLLSIPGIEVDPVASDGTTPLYYAAVWGYAEIIRMLHAAGASIFVQETTLGYSAINDAATYGELEAVETLIELGVDVDDISGYEDMSTPLMAASASGQTRVVEYLVSMGADLDIQDAFNMTALDHAVSEEYEDVEQILRKAAAAQHADGEKVRSWYQWIVYFSRMLTKILGW